MQCPWGNPQYSLTFLRRVLIKQSNTRNGSDTGQRHPAALQVAAQRLVQQKVARGRGVGGTAHLFGRIMTTGTCAPSVISKLA